MSRRRRRKSGAVGYGQPPEHTRFKPGQSGNPNGRPKGSKNMNTLLAEDLDSLITIREGGNERRVTKREAIVKALTTRAMKGDPKVAMQLLTFDSKQNEGEAEAEAPPLSPAEERVLKEMLAEQKTAKSRRQR